MRDEGEKLRLHFASDLAGITVVLLDDGNQLRVGVAVVRGDDTFDKDKGFLIASGRARSAKLGQRKPLRLALPQNQSFNNAFQEMGTRLLNTHQCAQSQIMATGKRLVDYPTPVRTLGRIPMVDLLEWHARIGCLAVLINYGIPLSPVQTLEVQAVLPILYCNALVRYPAHLELLHYLDTGAM